MLRGIVLSLAWGVSATCLVRPWFWKGVIEKDLFNYEGQKIGFDYNWKNNVKIEIIVFLIEFTISMVSYLVIGTRQNLYGSFPMIITCLYAQTLWAYQGKTRNNILLMGIILFVTLWLQDAIVGKQINVPLAKIKNAELAKLRDEQFKLFISPENIKNMFDVQQVNGPTHNNGRFVYSVSGGTTGEGLIIINKKKDYKAEFVECMHISQEKMLRERFPTKKIYKLYITISNADVPYGLFALADKEWIFGEYELDLYALINLVTGEISQFTREELPDFVTTT